MVALDSQKYANKLYWHFSLIYIIYFFVTYTINYHKLRGVTLKNDYFPIGKDGMAISNIRYALHIGLATEFRSEKIPRNRHGTAEENAHSVAFRGLRKSLFRSSERKEMAWIKLVLQNILIQQTKLTACFSRNSELLSLPLNGSEQNSECLFIFLFHGTEFRVFFSSVEWLGTEFRAFASNFVPWYRIPIIFLLCGTVRNGYPRIFHSVEQPEFRRNKPIVPSIPSSA